MNSATNVSHRWVETESQSVTWATSTVSGERAVSPRMIRAIHIYILGLQQPPGIVVYSQSTNLKKVKS